MSRNLNAASSRARKAPAKNIAAKLPTKDRWNSDGTVKTEKLAPMRALKMVNPHGAIVQVPLTNGFGLGVGLYGEKILSDKYKAGFIRFDKCPHADMRNVIPKGQEEPCGGEFSDEDSCPHVKSIIQARRAAKKIKHDKFAERCKTEAGALVDFLKAQAKRLGDDAEKADTKNARRMPGRTAPTDG